MTKNEKKVVGVIALIAVIIIIILLVTRGNQNKKQEEGNTAPKEEFVEVLEDGTRLNTSNKLHETKKIDGMEITNFQLTENGNVTLLLGTVTNTSGISQGGYPVSVRVVDKNQQEIVTVSAYIPPLEPGQSTPLNVGATFDYANAYDFSVTKK